MLPKRDEGQPDVSMARSSSSRCGAAGPCISMETHRFVALLGMAIEIPNAKTRDDTPARANFIAVLFMPRCSYGGACAGYCEERTG